MGFKGTRWRRNFKINKHIMKKLITILIILSSSIYSIYSQNKTIKGRIIDEHLEIIPGVSIIITDTVKIGYADLNGFFELDVPISVNKIMFYFPGIETAIINLSDNCDKVDLVMMYSVHYDFISLKKADRLRMKRFKKLPETHKKAYQMGLFTTDKTCYVQEFTTH